MIKTHTLRILIIISKSLLYFSVHGHLATPHTALHLNNEFIWLFYIHLLLCFCSIQISDSINNPCLPWMDWSHSSLGCRDYQASTPHVYLSSVFLKAVMGASRLKGPKTYFHQNVVATINYNTKFRYFRQEF